MYSVSFFENLRLFQKTRKTQGIFTNVSIKFVEGVIRTLCGVIIPASLTSAFHLRKELQLE